MQNWIKAVYEDLLCFIKFVHLTFKKFKYLTNNLNFYSARRIDKIKGNYKKKITHIRKHYSDIIFKYIKGNYTHNINVYYIEKYISNTHTYNT